MAYSNNRSTLFCPAGTKWYWEFVPTTGYNYAACGITTNSHEWDINPGGGNSTPSGHGVGFYGTELDVDGTRNMSAITAWASGDIVSFAYDVDNDEIKYYINGSLSYTYSSVPTSTDGPYSPSFGDFGGSAAATINVNFGQDSSFGGLKTAQGNQDGNSKGDFYYTPPSGYLALCSDNLPDSSIADPTAHFTTNLWSGDGTDDRTITTGFDVGLSWIKRRNGTNWHSLSDSVRAADPMPVLYSNDTSAETTDANAFAFVSNGYTVDDDNYYNASAGTYVGWSWKAGGTASSNTDGSITSSVSANPTAGFSIVSYTGTGANATVGHGLSQAPEFIIQKNRDETQPWWCYSKTIGAGGQISLDEANAQASDGAVLWNSTAPTSSVFSLGDNTGANGNADKCIVYCFHSVEGYSKVGSYVGNGVVDGTFIYTGFKPAFVMIKNTTTTGTNWTVIDTVRNEYNVAGKELYPNEADAEADYGRIDIVSNGFKNRIVGNYGNSSGDTYIYLAFAESPFKYSNAR